MLEFNIFNSAQIFDQIFAFKMCSDDQKNLIPSNLNLEDYCNTVAPVAAPIIIPLIQGLGSLSD